MTESELQRMDEAWEAASPGNLRAWVPALLEEVRRLRGERDASLHDSRKDPHAEGHPDTLPRFSVREVEALLRAGELLAQHAREAKAMYGVDGDAVAEAWEDAMHALGLSRREETEPRDPPVDEFGGGGHG